jgi:hypothetical protein
VSAQNGAGPIEEAFWRFHELNPHVYARLVQLARDLKARGRRRIGIGMLFEVLRWHHLSTVGDADGFKLNNNYRALYARLIMHREPDLAGVFHTRELTSPGREPFGPPSPGTPVGHVAPPRVDVPNADRLFDA